MQRIHIHVFKGEYMNATRFASSQNIFTGEEIIKVVPIPDLPARGGKGTTLHDAKFEKLLNFDQALMFHEDEFQSVRKALQRFMRNRGLQSKASIRQKKDHRTKTYTIWLVNQPPEVVIKKGTNEKRH